MEKGQCLGLLPETLILYHYPPTALAHFEIWSEKFFVTCTWLTLNRIK